MKETKCKMKQPGCQGLYVKWSISQRTCNSPLCAIRLVEIEKEKKARKHYLSEKKRLKSRAEWLISAKNAFNPYVRKRDELDPCISCGRLFIEDSIGGSWDCGHYLSVGSHPELRFEPLNAHKQCKSCNGGSGKYTRKNYTVQKEYRERLIAKIGLEKVEWLEGPHEPKKYTIPELQEICRVYKEKLKELTKCQQS
ncbi:MAG: NinG family protein [Desulfobulbaceae bacterium]|nr:NinG family protein [Desulfobulbaceae bacterium]